MPGDIHFDGISSYLEYCTHSVVNQDMMRTFVVGTILLGSLGLGSPRVAHKNEPLPRIHPKMTPEAAAACDPDYGWITLT